MLNSVNLTGRLTKDPELRMSQNNKPFGNFTLAVNRKYTDQNGERQADFINCVTFGKTAEVAKNYLSKGSLIGVEGELQTRNYENKDGQRVFVTEVKVNYLVFLETRNQQQNNNNNYQQNNYNQQSNVSRGDNPFSNDTNITESDLPF